MLDQGGLRAGGAFFLRHLLLLDPLLYPIVVLALSTGGRRGEILNPRRQDIDLKRERLVFQMTKNGERRLLPLKGLALALVKRHLSKAGKEADLLFPGKTNKPLALIAGLSCGFVGWRLSGG